MGIQVAVRISFRQMYDMKLGKSLSYVFVPAYFATRIPQITQNKGFGLQDRPEQIHMIEIYPISYHASVGKIS